MNNQFRNMNTCTVCDEEFDNDHDVAIHQLNHLVVTIPFLQICPFCKHTEVRLADALQHILNHLTRDKLEKSKLITWLSSQNHKDNIKKTSRVYKSSDVFRNFDIRLPTISYQHRCCFCNIFLKPEGKTINHALAHFFSASMSNQKKNHVILWFVKFFKTQESKQITKDYQNFIDGMKKLPRSNLLEKLPLFESEATNTCRECRMTASNASELHEHYVLRHSTVPTKYYNCSICNIKEENDEKFIAHQMQKHLKCICGSKYRRFDTCLQHARSCLNVRCPGCRQTFSCVGFSKHLDAENKDFMCPYCKEGETSWDQLRNHLKMCAGVNCPTCKNFRFKEERTFRNHLLQCKPWTNISNNEYSCKNGRLTKKENLESKNNLIKFTDIEDYLDNKKINLIKNCFQRIS